MLAVGRRRGFEATRTPAPASLSCDGQFPVVVDISEADDDTWLADLGLLWSDGVEPSGSENTLYPFQPGGSRRIWYVNADASSNGNGTVNSPYWSLTEVNEGIGSGDHVWLTGEFNTAKASRGAMHIGITSSSRVGTVAIPTVVRSWPGRSRAKFDGNYVTRVGVQIDPANDGNSGAVVLNIEVTRCTPVGPIILGAGGNGEGIAYQRIISCWIHHNYALAGGPNSNYGGAYVVAKVAACDIEVANNLTHDNNTSNGTTIQESNNIGGLSLLSDPGAAGSVVRFHHNLQFNEHLAIRHKHDNDVSFESDHNYAYNCSHMHYVRVSTLNDIHHNVFRDGSKAYSAFILQEAENQIAARTIDAYNNTVVRVARFVGDGDTTFSESDIFGAHENIYYNPTYTSSDTPVVLGYYSTRNYNTAGATFDNNCVYTGSSTNFWRNNGTVSTRAQFETQFGTDNIYTDPLFTDVVGNDFTLQAGSPCLSINGQRAGAL